MFVICNNIGFFKSLNTINGNVVKFSLQYYGIRQLELCMVKRITRKYQKIVIFYVWFVSENWNLEIRDGTINFGCSEKNIKITPYLAYHIDFFRNQGIRFENYK